MPQRCSPPDSDAESDEVTATEEVGRWDCVEGKFYPNKGGTAFNTP